jgi:hypothetical protein
MDRRNFLKWSGLASIAVLVKPQYGMAKPPYSTNSFASQAHRGESIEAGWLDSPEVARYFVENNTNPYLSQVNEDIRGTGKGKIALLWPFLEQVTGKSLVPHAQETGDCVSHASGLGVDILAAVQIIKRKSPQLWVAPAATEIIYAGGRIEIAKKSFGQTWRAGMTGTVAAEFVKRYGVLLRQKYLKWDFTDYSGQVADQLGRTGVPDELEPLCRLHPVGNVALVRSYDEARDCIYNGYPVVLCSSQGFNTRGGRDKDGFLAPSRNPWMHSMLLAGIDDAYTRPGGLVQNSWGSSWIDGPKRHNQPDGSFWADSSVIDRICRQGDTIALSCYAGYPRQNYSLW